MRNQVLCMSLLGKLVKKDYEERRSIMDANPIHVAIAGRMMFKRVMGKASFCNIQDLQGSIHDVF